MVTQLAAPKGRVTCCVHRNSSCLHHIIVMKDTRVIKTTVNGCIVSTSRRQSKRSLVTFLQSRQLQDVSNVPQLSTVTPHDCVVMRVRQFAKGISVKLIAFRNQRGSKGDEIVGADTEKRFRRHSPEFVTAVFMTTNEEMALDFMTGSQNDKCVVSMVVAVTHYLANVHSCELK